MARLAIVLTVCVLISIILASFNRFGGTNPAAECSAVW